MFSRKYSWPGNIRELRNVVERLLLLAGARVEVEDVQIALPAGSGGIGHAGEAANGEKVSDVSVSGGLAERVLRFERAEVLKELERHGRHATQTAKALGLERSHLYKKCQQLGIDLKNSEEPK